MLISRNSSRSFYFLLVEELHPIEYQFHVVVFMTSSHLVFCLPRGLLVGLSDSLSANQAGAFSGGLYT